MRIFIFLNKTWKFRQKQQQKVSSNRQEKKSQNWDIKITWFTIHFPPSLHSVFNHRHENHIALCEQFDLCP